MKVAICARVVCSCALVLLAAPAAFAQQAAEAPGRGVKQVAYTARQGGGPQTINLLSQGEVDVDEAPSYADPLPAEPGAIPEATAPWQEIDTDAGCDTCDTCNADCGGACGSRSCMGGLWYGSIDYLLFRPRVSQAVVEVRRQESTDSSTSPSTTYLDDHVVAWPFKYNSAFRVSAGYRLLDCGGDFQVSYWRLTNDTTFVDGPANPSTNNPLLVGQLENNPGAGESLNAWTGITANIIDADFAKCISMGGPCSPCDTCFCPRWDLRFFAGARAADISRYNDNAVIDVDGDESSVGNINARFVGAGPRVGIQGRRYFGQCGLWSVYAKGAQGLLIGDYKETRTLSVPSETGTTPNQVTNEFNTFSRMIPVSDIEIGGTWQAAPYTFISVGYFFQCWWDLGYGEQIQGTNFGALDSSNILGFDGLFVRGEMLF
ncbi:MAG: hypothetical protein DWQ37_10490 [Planctomycetota bacterium]|nr:MAG: hypothetical protein DWQ37_10490 [Planctomycetota bacterium]